MFEKEKENISDSFLEKWVETFSDVKKGRFYGKFDFAKVPLE